MEFKAKQIRFQERCCFSNYPIEKIMSKVVDVNNGAMPTYLGPKPLRLSGKERTFQRRMLALFFGYAPPQRAFDLEFEQSTKDSATISFIFAEKMGFRSEWFNR